MELILFRDTKDQKVLVFTGAMDCYANVDGVTWFSREIFPSVKETFPDALFYIVGSNPAPTPWCRQINPGMTGLKDPAFPKTL